MDISTLFPSDNPSRGPIAAHVRDWLLQQLEQAPRRAAEVRARATAEGISPTALKRARKELARLRQIETVRQSVGNSGAGRWVLRRVETGQEAPLWPSEGAAQGEPNKRLDCVTQGELDKTRHCPEGRNGAGVVAAGSPHLKNSGNQVFQVGGDMDPPPGAPQPTKTYVCTRWPRLCVRHLRFRDGRYETDDPDEQALIERADAYGVHIHLVVSG